MNHPRPTRLVPAGMAPLRLIRLAPRALAVHSVRAVLPIPLRECPSLVRVVAQAAVREGSMGAAVRAGAAARVGEAARVADRVGAVVRAGAAVRVAAPHAEVLAVPAESGVRGARIEPRQA